MTKKFEFFIYNHENREFTYYKGTKKKLKEIMKGTPPEISTQLELEGIDGLLIMDDNSERWFLVFADNMGIVATRTARRMADSIIRSGTKLPDGFWLKVDYPLEELSDPNLGDLWKSVQQKYVKGDLIGMQLDEETGLPSQIKERAERLKVSGHTDALTEAKQEKAEAAARKKARTRSTSKKPATKKMVSKTPAPKRKTPVKSAPKKTSPPKTAVKKTTVVIPPKKTTPKSSKQFLEIDNIVDYVDSGSTVRVIKGRLSFGTDQPEDKTVILSQTHLSYKEWTDIAVFLEKGNIAEVTLTTKEDSNYITSLKI
jgi:hypothetical protein